MDSEFGSNHQNKKTLQIHSNTATTTTTIIIIIIIIITTTTTNNNNNNTNSNNNKNSNNNNNNNNNDSKNNRIKTKKETVFVTVFVSKILRDQKPLVTHSVVPGFRPFTKNPQGKLIRRCDTLWDFAF